MNRFTLKFIWLEKSIGVSLDQVMGSKTNPLTEYFFWPQQDSWEEMKLFLEKRSWISQAYSISLLNQITDVITFWQEKDSIKSNDTNVLMQRFPGCSFIVQE
uniref:30S ribosomal protein 3, chloroplastic n=1 Tax=Euglenaformis proxima TaxID=299110 RepID=A0A023HI02_9EUGL|nr:putative ribosomal protein 3 [Euglenaformis proxima]AGL11974.1 putative ribosomal protein 3 [Euglenaformis proxima]